jgi:hypothetical protein
MEKNKTIIEHIEAWKSSGLTRIDYARREGIKYGTFKNWVYEREKKSPKLDWKAIKVNLEEEIKETNSFFKLRIGGKWRFEIHLRIRL